MAFQPPGELCRAVLLACGAVGFALVTPPAAAQLAVSVNDNKVQLVNGNVVVVANPRPDTVAVLDLGAFPPRKLAEIAAPASVVGPPLSVALTPDERLALVTSNQKIDPANPAQQVADNRMSVLDLRANPLRVLQTVETGSGPAGVSINQAGTLALVANRSEGTVSAFAIRGDQLAPLGKLTIGAANSGPSHVAITPDGRRALVTRDGDSMITVLAIDGDRVALANRDINAGLRPYGLAIHPSGRLAVVANIGRGGGDADTISVVDLTREPYRVIDTLTVGPSPEGIQISPDGRYVAVVTHNGSNRAPASPFYADSGRVLLFRVDGMALRRLGQAPIGRWSQGVAFSRDGRTLLVQNMAEKEIQVFRIEGGRLRDSGRRIPTDGGPAAIRIADRPG